MAGSSGPGGRAGRDHDRSAYGVVSGFVGGLPDAVLMRFVDTGQAIPVAYVIIDLVSEFKPTLLFVLVLSLLSWLSPAWLQRGQAGQPAGQGLRRGAQDDGRSTEADHRPASGAEHDEDDRCQRDLQVDAILSLAVLSNFGFRLPPPTATRGAMLLDQFGMRPEGRPSRRSTRSRSAREALPEAIS
jgi:peptide/nickel transport system permease protein